MAETIRLQNTAARPRAPWITGSVAVDGRTVPVASTQLSRSDVIDGWKVRWDIGRMSFSVLPGLYAVGAPTKDSPVLVTANYKLTFDKLRAALGGIDAWIMVLDTKGINVWCAAGKGTFGTKELVHRISAVKLDEVVSHRTLILPQLGAPGVAAHEVREETGWRVKYGPVLAKDLPAYLAAGQKKTDAMRLVPFGLADRLTIGPAELSHAWPFLLAILVAAGLFALPFSVGYVPRLLKIFLPLLGSVLIGTIVFPALLPWIPFRAFSIKGAILGALWGLASAFAIGASLASGAALLLIATPIAAFLAMNFTGASTFTCQPGAALEVKRGLVPMIASLVAGIGLRVAASILGL
jgi:hypothetical protein